jgi:hypothetical protein
MNQFKGSYKSRDNGSVFLENTAQVVFVLGLLSGIIAVIVGIAEYETAWSAMIAGIFLIINVSIIKGFAKVIASINDNLEAIKEIKIKEINTTETIENKKEPEVKYKPFDPYSD